MQADQSYATILPGSVTAGLILLVVLSVASIALLLLCLRLRRRWAQAERSNADLIRHLSEGIYRSSIDGRQLSANPALVRLNGYSTEEEMLASVGDIAVEWYVDPGRRDEFRRILHSQGKVENFVSEVYRHKTRERIWITESARVVYDERSGQPLFYEGSVRDITATMEKRLLEERYRKLISKVPGGLFQFELSEATGARYTFLNPGFERVTGLTVESMLDDPYLILSCIHPDDQKQYRSTFLNAQAQLSVWDIEFRIRTPRGDEKWLRVTAEPEPLGRSTLWHGYIMDISMRKRQDAEIEALAYRDPLTGLSNRRCFFRSMESMMAGLRDEARAAALLFIDLDNFKQLNDTAGHDAGDTCLRRVAEVLQAHAGPGEIAARIGGDEFVLTIACETPDKADVAQAAMRRGQSILDALRTGLNTLTVSASIGVVVFDSTTTSVDDILQRADRAMYRAKQTGRDRLVLCDSHAKGTSKRIKIAAPRIAPTIHELEHFRPRRRRVN